MSTSPPKPRHLERPHKNSVILSDRSEAEGVEGPAVVLPSPAPPIGANERPAIIRLMDTSNLDNDCFISVDLEVFSKSELKSLVTAFGSKVHVHYLGMEFGLFKAYL